jgi:amino acid adenylation domain-containing protein/non-ribosomal peptide synthase protein (TIGR01720 family)
MNPDRIAKLSPQKRQLLEKLLMARQGQIPQERGNPSRMYPRSPDEDIPLSAAQKRMWFLAQSQPNSPDYNVPLTMRLRGVLSYSALEASLNEIVRRHEVLRTAFPLVQAEPRPAIAQDESLALSRIHLAHLPLDKAEAMAIQKAEAEISCPFDLAQSPLLRGVLFQLAPEDHVLLLVFHHIVFDGWSLRVVFRELEQIYPAITQGKAPQLAPLTIQYTDYAVWEQKTLVGDTHQRLLSYWTQKLADAPPKLSFSGCQRIDRVNVNTVGSLKLEITGASYARLQGLCQEQGLTPFIVLLATLKLLLQQFCMIDDIVVGTLNANRNDPQLENLIGCFINPLALRTDLSGNPTFIELCQRVKETLTGALAHQELPFDRIVRALQVRTEGSRHPLFNVVFGFRTQAMESWQLGDLMVEPLPNSEAKSLTPKFDLIFSLVDTGQTLEGAIEYDQHLFSEATVTVFQERYRHLLASALQAATNLISDISILPAAYQQKLLSEWNSPKLSLPVHRAFHHLFEAIVDQTPNQLAITSSHQNLTYAELENRANQLAHCLMQRGFDSEQIALIYLERSPAIVIAILAILKAGGAFLILDPRFTSNRLEHILTTTRPSLILTDSNWLSAFSPDSPTYCFDQEQAELDHPPTTRPAVPIHPAQLAYLICTSGSTGTPKTVMAHHQGVCHLSDASKQVLGLTKTDRLLQFASFTFDAFLWELLMVWGVGATLHMTSWEEVLPGPNLVELLRRERITALSIPPSVLMALPPAELPDLRTLIVGGEACTEELITRWQSGRRIINAYGPTEITVWATYDDCREGEIPPIGVPVPNLQVYVLDAHLELVPPGVIGEIYIGGVGLTRGYFGQPDLTAERFIPHPFATEPGARLYRTGDLGSYLPDGRLQFKGRADDQVKIRGFRIEPGEVRHALAQHPSIAQAHVMPVEWQPGQPRLVAWYVSDSRERELPPFELREWLERRLPRYMHPSRYVCLESMPLTSHGKIDRRRLPLPDWQTGEPTAESPLDWQNPTEAALGRIWSEVLGNSRIGRHDNFFELGGDSIISIQIVSRANQAGIGLKNHQIFEFPTVAQLATVASTSIQPKAAQELIVGPVPLTPIQHWFLSQPSTNSPSWNQTVLLEVRADFSEAVITTACRALYAHHDALRLQLQRVEGQWSQTCREPNALDPWCAFDLSALDADVQLEMIARIYREQAASFDAGQGTLAQFFFFQRGASAPPLLLLSMHHWVVDGYSWRILIEDLVIACQQATRQAAIQFSPKTTSYRNWGQYLENLARSLPVDQVPAIWAWAAGDHLPSPPLPLDHPARLEDNTEASAHKVVLSLDASATRRLLTELPVRTQTSIQSVLVATLVRVIGYWTGQRQVLLDLEGHGRDTEVDLSRTVGWFTTLYPMRFDFAPSDAPLQTLRQVHQKLTRLPQGGLAYGLHRYLASETEAARVLQQLAAPPIIFNYLGQFDQTLPPDAPFLPFELPILHPQPSDSKRSHLIEINCSVGDGQFSMAWTYSRALHVDQTIAHLANAFLREIHQLLAIALVDSDSTALVNRACVPSPHDSSPPQVIDFYRLSPLQEGLLFHCLKSSDPALYVQQSHTVLRGALNVNALQQAWQTVLERHDILRTAFIWHQVDAPVQQVYQNLQIPFRQEDWRHLSPETQVQQWQAFRRQDREQGFVFDRPPLLRCGLFQVNDNTHYFSWTSHHLLLDGWSLAALIREVLALYHATTTQIPIQLPPVLPFKNYINWLNLRDTTEATAYWKHILHDAEACSLCAHLPIEANLTREADSAPEFDQVIVTIPETVITQLKAFCQQNRLTLNTLFQSSWALVLSRYINRADVIYGLTLSGRPAEIPNIENAIGLFINTLPLRLQVPQGRSIVDWLGEVQQCLQELRRYEFSALTEVQRYSRVPGGELLFDTLVVFQNYPVMEMATSRPQEIQIEAESSLERTDYPLTIIIEPGQSFQIRVIYNRRQLAESLITQMATHLCNALTMIPTSSDRPVAEWSMLDREESVHLLQAWNQTHRNYSFDSLLHQRIAEQAVRFPNHLAVIFEEQSLTYAELNQRANQLAHWLQNRGVKPETVVGVYADRSLELMIALLAILKAGGAFLPLSVESPEAMLNQILQQSRPQVVLIQGHLLKTLNNLIDERTSHPLINLEVIAVDQANPPWMNADSTNPVVSVSPDNLAYLLYTSGSTGEPKGVMNRHQGLLNRLLWTQEAYPLTPDDRVLQKTPYTFDVSIWEFFWPLLSGACLVMARSGGHWDTVYLTALIEQAGISVIHFVPSMLQVFLERLQQPQRCQTLRMVLCSGEALSPSLRNQCLDTLPATGLINLYGPTEAAIDVSYWSCQPHDRAALVPIGYPVANTQLYILSPDGIPCPVGIVGELCIGGVQLARGYLNRPDLTAEKFMPHPCSNQPGQLLYRTGDLARYGLNGAIEYIGRSDFQVKIHGQRVELSEIEETLRAYPDIRDAVVVYHPVSSEQKLIAYIVPNTVTAPVTSPTTNETAHTEAKPVTTALNPVVNQGFIDRAALQRFLLDRLPRYMLPSDFITLDALPLNANGKLDRKALPAPTTASSFNPDQPFIAPQTDVQIALAQCWAELLHCDRVGLREHFFFDLGGNSLLALRLLGQVEQQWAVTVDLARFLQNPTVEGMAEQLQAATHQATKARSAELVAIQSQGSQAPLFLVHPALGTVLGFYELTRALGHERPVYAFEAPGVDGRHPIVNRVPEFASRYIAAMRQVKPVGPYILAGYSFGGVVAFEMAQQLRAIGEEIEALMILDTLMPATAAGTRNTTEIDDAKMLVDIAHVLQRYSGSPPLIALEDIAALNLEQQIAYVRQSLTEQGVLNKNALSLEGLLAVNRGVVEALTQYRPSPYSGAIHLIRCHELAEEDRAGIDPTVIADTYLGWQPWSTQPIQVHLVAANHISLLQKPAVTKVAQIIQDILSQDIFIQNTLKVETA